MDVKDKTALITGAGGGIGRGIARALAGAGCEPVIVDIDQATAEVVAEECRASGVRALALDCDVSRDDAVAALPQRVADAGFGPVDILVNNVGGLTIGETHVLPTDAWRHAVDTDLLSGVRGVQAFVPGMIERGYGHVVNTASIGALLPVSPIGPVLCAMKAAVFGLSQSLYLSLVPQGIGVSVLCPWIVRTAASEAAHPEAMAAAGMEGSPAVEAEEVGQIVLDAIEQGRFLLFTDPTHYELIHERYADLDAALDGDVAYLAAFAARA
ncbi:MAG TPA: SDR family oxidoreductase [Solirubrobacteraceae bacterium]|nr:SDR family oxidoreductase [Solirubrobacteraceae bacterium]